MVRVIYTRRRRHVSETMPRDRAIERLQWLARQRIEARVLDKDDRAIGWTWKNNGRWVWSAEA